MAVATRARKAPTAASQDEGIPQAPQSTPSMGGGDFSPFVWDRLGAIQQTLGSIEAKLDQNKEASAKLDVEISKIKADLSEFKQIRHTAKVIMWLVGVTCAAVFTVASYIAKEAWSIFKPGAVQQIQPQQAQPPQPPSSNK